jgi:hypothetical protein
MTNRIGSWHAKPMLKSCLSSRTRTAHTRTFEYKNTGFSREKETDRRMEKGMEQMEAWKGWNMNLAITDGVEEIALSVEQSVIQKPRETAPRQGELYSSIWAVTGVEE